MGGFRLKIDITFHTGQVLMETVTMIILDEYLEEECRVRKGGDVEAMEVTAAQEVEVL